MYFGVFFFLDQVGIEVVRIVCTCHQESPELRGLLDTVCCLEPQKLLWAINKCCGRAHAFGIVDL
jgi:hypothetical protein